MSLNFENNVIRCLKWCSILPLRNHAWESPIFSLNCNDWFLRLVNDGDFELHLVLETKRNESISCRVDFKIGFKFQEKLSLAAGEFDITKEKHTVWSIRDGVLRERVPFDFIMGNKMKFQFYFHDVVEIAPKKSKDDKSIQTPSYIDTRFILENITEDFCKLLDEDRNYDVEFTCEDQTIKAHKVILSNRSDVFASMLHSDMIEGKTGRVDIQDMDATAFKQFLKFLYTGILPDLTVDTAIRFYEAGDKYNVPTLKRHCADYLTDSLSPENMCEILIFADRHNDSGFKNIVIQYIKGQKTP